MRYDASTDPWASQFCRCLTPEGDPIPLAVWVDTETGEVGRLDADEKGCPKLGEDGEPVMVVEKRPFRLIRTDTNETIAVCE